MIVQAKLKHLKGIQFHEYALRFLFGGACTLAAGLIARRWGAATGGLFLAFPAIFPAGACLIEDHEIKHKQTVGANGRPRGRMLAGIDALGAALGSVGLAAFGFVVWKMLPQHAPAAVIFLATVAWLAASVTLWMGYKKHLLRPAGDKLLSPPRA